MEDLAVFTAISHSGSFGKNFVTNFVRIWSVRMVKNCDLGLENEKYFQDLGHSFSPYGPPSRQITYIYLPQISIFNGETNRRVSYTMFWCLNQRNLWCKNHINCATIEISKTIGMVAKLRYFVPSSAMNIYKSLILPY